MATEPAQVNGNCASGFAVFQEEANGDLVDIVFYCLDCAEDRDILGLWWPGFDWSPDYDSCCDDCGKLINAGSIDL